MARRVKREQTEYERLSDASVEAAGRLADLVRDSEAHGLGALGWQEAKDELLNVGKELARSLGSLHRWLEAITVTKEIDSAPLQSVVASLKPQIAVLRRFAGPLNVHYFSEFPLYTIPLTLEHLPKLLAPLSEIDAIDAQLRNELYLAASELDLLRTAVEVGAAAKDDAGTEATSVDDALELLKAEIDAAASNSDSTDIAVLRKRLNDALDQAEGTTAKLTDILDQIRDTAERIDAQRAALDRLVDQARELGGSWGKIGSAAGISAQSAHKRWDPAAREKARLYMQEYTARDRS